MRRQSSNAYALLVVVAVSGCREKPAQRWAPGPDPAENVVEILARTPKLKTYPCLEQCHNDLKPNPAPRDLEEFHRGKQLVHGGMLLWCNWCHSESNLDRLRLLDNALVTFDESHRLCGQCHGEKHRDWRAGIHGKQTGAWHGRKSRLSCPECHNPHRPKIGAIIALPPPRRGAAHP